MENWQEGVLITSEEHFWEIFSDYKNWQNSIIFVPQATRSGPADDMTKLQIGYFIVLDDYEGSDMGKIIEFHRLPHDKMEQIFKEHFGRPLAHILSAKNNPYSWIGNRDKGLLEKIYTELFGMQESGYGDKEYESNFMEMLLGQETSPGVWPSPPIFIQKIQIPDSINHEWLRHSRLLRRWRTKEEMWAHQGRDTVTGEWIDLE